MMYLGIDFGKKRIGLSLGSVFPKTAGVLDGADSDRAIGQIVEIAKENEAEKIVLGLPTRSMGEPGTLDREIRDFGERVAVATGLEVVYEEEQFTSSDANEYLKSRGLDIGEAKAKVDEIAAVLILEQYLEKEGKKGNK